MFKDVLMYRLLNQAVTWGSSCFFELGLFVQFSDLATSGGTLPEPQWAER